MYFSMLNIYRIVLIIALGATGGIKAPSSGPPRVSPEMKGVEGVPLTHSVTLPIVPFVKKHNIKEPETSAHSININTYKKP